MNKLKKLSLLTFLAMMSFTANADDNPTTYEKQRVKIIIPSTPNKPRVPSRQSVECYYDGESLYLSFAYSEGACILTVTDNVTLAEDDYAFDSSVPATINIGYVSDASLTITTSLGQTYTGQIE